MTAAVSWVEKLSGAVRAVPIPGLSLLVLFGSRARGDARDGSDWDLAYIGDENFDGQVLRAMLVATVGEDIDLVDLGKASGLLRYRVAADAIPIFESKKGNFNEFWFDAVRFWCEAAPVLESGYQAILAGLGP